MLERTRDPWLRTLCILLVLIAGLYLAGLVWSILVQFADILALFFFAWLLAFMLEPAVAFVQARYQVPRSVAVSTVYVGLFLLLGGVIFWLVPALVAQVVIIAYQWPLYVDNAAGYAAWLQRELGDRGLPVQSDLWANYQELTRRLAEVGPPLLANFVTLARNTASFVVDAVIVLILSVYLMLDSRRLASGAMRAVPAQWRDDAAYFMESVRQAFGGFIRGQLVLSGVYGLGTGLVMSIAGLDFALLAGVFAGLIMLIPFVGPVLSIVPPALIALLVHPERLWWVVLLLVVIQFAVVNVLSPRVMSQTIGMHPLLVIAAVLVGAKVAGVWGAVFGVPIAGVLAAMIGFYRLTLEERRQRAAQIHELANMVAGPPPALGEQTVPSGRASTP